MAFRPFPVVWPPPRGVYRMAGAGAVAGWASRSREQAISVHLGRPSEPRPMALSWEHRSSGRLEPPRNHVFVNVLRKLQKRSTGDSDDWSEAKTYAGAGKRR